MMRSLFSGVSGLKGHQTKMDVIGNNIANVNTTGFKSSRVTFADTLSQTQSNASAPGNNIGGINPKQIGLGVGVASIDTIFTDGSVQATGKNTDVAISGNALFIMKKGSETYYTRDGAFEFDGDGNYVLPGSGLYVQGWMGENGVVDTKGSVSNIQIPAGKSMEPTLTTMATYSHNLNADELKLQGIKINDDNGNSITVDPTNTDKWSIGGTYTSTITSMDLTATNGLSLSGVTGAYAMGGRYAFAGTDITVTLANTDKISVPLTSSTTYKVGNTIPSASNGITNYNSGRATFKDGSVLTNNSGTTYKVTFGNGDIISVPQTSSGNYTTGSALPDTVSASLVNGKDITLSPSGDILKNESGSPYKATLVGGYEFTIPSKGKYGIDTYNNPFAAATVKSVRGDTLTLTMNDTAYPEEIALTNTDSSRSYTVDIAGVGTLTIAGTSSTTYTADSEFPTAVYVREKSADTGAGTLTLSDNSTIDVDNLEDYMVNQTITGTLGDINGFTVSNISEITGLPTATISAINPEATSVINQIEGAITSENGTADNFITTSDSVAIRPDSGIIVSALTLTDDKNNHINVKSSDTNVYKTGDTYTSTISSMVITMSDGTELTKNNGSYTIGHSLPLTTTLTIYDTLGNAHNVMVYFTKTKTDSTNGNQWTASLNLDGSGQTTITEKDGSITTLTMPDTVLQFDTMGKYVDGTGNIQLTLSNGAKDSFGSQAVTIDLTQLTQFSGGNTISGACNGNAMGTLKSVSITSSGVITGTYTNGITQAEAQIALAQFNNAAGLTKTGTSLYQVSRNSGNNGADAEPMSADDLGITLTPSALELSNVDIANEFSEMITTQRGFQSNSKIITVSDEMLETMINMKR